MTGEMSREEVTPEAYPLHFAIADALGGSVHPFDQYQGPFVSAEREKFWLIGEDDSPRIAVFAEGRRRQSEWLFPHHCRHMTEAESKAADAMTAADVIDAARVLLTGGGFDPDNADMQEDAERLADMGEA